MAEYSFEQLAIAIIAILLLGIVVFYFLKFYISEKEGLSKENIECNILYYIPFICSEEDLQKLQQAQPQVQLQQAQKQDKDFLDKFISTFNSCKADPNSLCKCEISLDEIYNRNMLPFTFVIVKKGNSVNIQLDNERRTINNINYILINKYSKIQQRQVINPINLDTEYLKGTNRIIIYKATRSRTLKTEDYLKVEFQDTTTQPINSKTIIDYNFLNIQQGVGSFGSSLDEASVFYASKIGIANTNGNLLLYLPQAIDIDNKLELLYPLPSC